MYLESTITYHCFTLSVDPFFIVLDSWYRFSLFKLVKYLAVNIKRWNIAVSHKIIRTLTIGNFHVYIRR